MGQKVSRDSEGLLHSYDDKPAIQRGRIKYWYTHGLLDRKDGPAILNDRTHHQMYYKDGLIHREDGPAVYKNDKQYYFICGDHLNKSLYYSFICHLKVRRDAQPPGVELDVARELDNFLSLVEEERERIERERCNKKTERGIYFKASAPSLEISKESDIPEQAEQAENKECVVCMENKVDSVFIPCGHASICIICSLRLDKCPICRAKGKVHRIYI